MGNKKKVGKSRKDKFYQLAKESGFRARSAFKLIQLNRKFEFLQNSRVVIDLCAAPGGWLQVVTENSPISSLIIGVDLVPIRPIRNVTTLVDDITTEKCRQDLRKELHTWKADCVLHDGAPNVGKNWVHDAFQQVQLTLQALKLATDFLKKGGWFVTKVFRSKDYNSLLWVFQQLFRNVFATKPQASRNESAEIFVVCKNYLAPDRIDPKFLDPKYVFKDVESEPKKALDLIHPEKQKRHREGYPEGDYTLFHTLKVTDFFQSENFLELFADASEIVFDDKKIEKDPSTTVEIKECLKDIKVLGKKEIRMIINWRKKLKKELGGEKNDKNIEKAVEVEEEEGNSDDDVAKLEEQLADLEGEERKVLKRKIKKTRKEKAKLQHKMDLKMILPNDALEMSDDRGLFQLNEIKTKKQLNEVEEVDLNDMDEDDEEDEESDDDDVQIKKRKTMSFDRETKDYLDPNDASDDEEMEDSDSESNEEDGDISLDELDEEDANPLLIGRPGKKAKTDMWFSKDSFAGIENDDDEDIEIEKMVEVYKKKGGVIRGVNDKEEDTSFSEDKVDDDGLDDEEKKDKKKKDKTKKKGAVSNSEDKVNSDDSDSESESDSDTDSDSDYDTKEFYKQQNQSNKGKKASKKEGFEVVAAGEQPNVRLSAKGLAIGAALVSSRKRRREVIESGYHKYMFNDENLPEWFTKDESKHHHIQLPVTKGDVEEYKMKMKAVDANPIRKIAEAKARKKRKMVRKLDRARKKSEVINETEDVTDREKWQQIKQVYKRAGLLSAKKKEIQYVVAKKGTAGKRVSRPHGVSGPFKVVDGRMKKDNRAEKRAAKQKKGKGKKKR